MSNLLLVFPWVQTVRPLSQIYFCTATCMRRISCYTQADIIEAFNNTSRYLDDIDKHIFDTLIPFIYQKELRLNKTNQSYVRSHFKIQIISSKIYDKRNDFDIAMVNYQHMGRDVPRATSYGVNISQHIRFTKACSSVEDFDIRI